MDGLDHEAADHPTAAAAPASSLAGVIGRERELELVLAAVASGRDVLLEGPPGTSKTTLLKAITSSWGIPLVFVEGNADLTSAKMLGHHNPARVLREGYSPDNFTDGPLLQAMRTGGFLYIEELNRAPEDTVNVLLSALGEREVTVPRVGQVRALPTFRVIASINPFDNIGTTRLSPGIYDRLCRLSVTYQDEESERQIVAVRAATANQLPPAFRDTLVEDAVALTRATREHPTIRQGSSVRGAIDLASIAAELLARRRPSPSEPGPGRGNSSGSPAYAATVLDAMLLALSGRIRLHETVESTPEDVLREIWQRHFASNLADLEPG